MAPVNVLCVIYDLVLNPRNFFNFNGKSKLYSFYSLNFLYDPCMISRKSYMVLVWLPRIHTNHIWPSMITKNHIWPSTKSKKVVWSLTRVFSALEKVIAYHSYAWKLPLAFVVKCIRPSFIKCSSKFYTVYTTLLNLFSALQNIILASNFPKNSLQVKLDDYC